jgi:hypothetical protein
MSKADEIADKLLASIPSRFLEPHQLTRIEVCALAAAAGCEMNVRMVGQSMECSTKHDVNIQKEGELFLVFERVKGEPGRLKGRVRGLALKYTQGDHRLQ